MKVMKSLLLGAAAGLVATAGAQAADLPVKAKAVEYVKVCSAYGAGFYYIPGTDICLRVGGYVYLETGVKGTNAVANIYAATGGEHNRNYNYNNWRTSARIILDARQNTAYGTLRAYMSTGGNFNSNHANVTSWDAAFIQFAGFTWGFTNSFYNFAHAGYGVVASMATPWNWLNVAAYTAQLGNGMTASLSIEDPRGRRAAIFDGLGGTGDPNGYGGSWAPDVVGNIAVSQAWGRAQIMGALHQVKTDSRWGGVLGIDDVQGSKWGYAVGAGIELKTGGSNTWILQGNYAKGAANYTGFNSSPTAAQTAGGNSFSIFPAFFEVNDAGFNADGSLDLTKSWSVYTAYRHFWTPALRTSFGYGYFEHRYGANTIASAFANKGRVHQGNVSTVWSPVSGLDLSLDIVYSKVDDGVVSEDLWTAWTRLRRNF